MVMETPVLAGGVVLLPQPTAPITPNDTARRRSTVVKLRKRVALRRREKRSSVPGKPKRAANLMGRLLPRGSKAALLVALRVSVAVWGAELDDVKERLAGLKLQVRPTGAPAQENVTVPLYGPLGVMERVAVAVPPEGTLT